jgi:hypothetical protein
LPVADNGRREGSGCDATLDQGTIARELLLLHPQGHIAASIAEGVVELLILGFVIAD